MGYRTVVIINNDWTDQIQDPVLKNLVCTWSNRFGKHQVQSSGPYTMIEQTHADTASLIKVDCLRSKVLAYGQWNQKDLDLVLLKEAADKLGYRLVKKSQPKR